jgi:EAL domain-containing protein (putative c-di-GMP-specific phosphodiesterase class I)
VAPNTKRGAQRKVSALSPKSDGQVAVIATDVQLRMGNHSKLEAELLRSLKVLMHPNRQGGLFGLLCVRVDAREAVEALLGPQGVQQLLNDAFHRLRNCVRTTDIVAPGEAGIFFILATDLQSEDELEIISDRIQRTCRQSYWIDDQEIRSGLTTGGVGGSEGQADPATLTQHAVLAMRRASSRGVPFEFFGTPTPKAASTPAALASGKAEATTEEAFELNFEPQFTADLTLRGARVGVRMPPSSASNRVKSVAALDAERKKKNERIGDRVLRTVLLQVRSWVKSGLVVPVLSIEIEANHLLNSGFADSLLKLLHETNTQGSAIDLLLTEATTLTSLGSAQRTLNVLAEAGVQFGLSGFSLNAGTRLDLRKLPFSSLRLSCTSLFKATSAGESLWLTRSIVGVAHRCGLVVVGEDVASEAQRDILLQSGCDRFEGPLYSPAISSQEMESLLRNGHPSA